jgi:hypothetical protein
MRFLLGYGRFLFLIYTFCGNPENWREYRFKLLLPTKWDLVTAPEILFFCCLEWCVVTSLEENSVWKRLLNRNCRDRLGEKCLNLWGLTWSDLIRNMNLMALGRHVYCHPCREWYHVDESSVEQERNFGANKIWNAD